MKSITRQLVIWILIIVGVFLLYQVFSGKRAVKERTLSYTELRKKVEERQVREAIIEEGSGIRGQLVNGEIFRTEVSNIMQAEITKAMEDAGVILSFKTISSSQWVFPLISYAPPVVLLGLTIFILIRQMRSGDRGLSISKFLNKSNSTSLYRHEAFAYDIALSFAGEDRDYVEQVAAILRQEGIRVFYDKYEQVRLWGKDLYMHLTQVYQNEARYTVMFISEHYAKKLWTNRERESAQARAFTENREYILPARFDDTVVPGMLSTTGYISLRNTSPRELVDLILEKLSSTGV